MSVYLPSNYTSGAEEEIKESIKELRKVLRGLKIKITEISEEVSFLKQKHEIQLEFLYKQTDKIMKLLITTSEDLEEK